MTEHHETDPGEARAEQAFTHAFAQAEQLDSTTRIDTGVIRQRARTRSRLKMGGSALAMLLVAGGVVGGVRLIDNDHPESGPGIVDGPAPEGMRYDYYRGMRVTVPADWKYRSEPGSDWCVGDPQNPPDPYIDLGSSGATLAIGCPASGVDDSDGMSNQPPTRLWAEHVQVMPASRLDVEPAVAQFDEWWVLRQQVGDVVVKAVSTDRARAQTWLDDAVEVQDGQSGCLSHGAIQDGVFPRPDPAFDVTELDSVDSIRVCLYENLEDADANGLAGVASLTGDEAIDVLHAIQAAPAGGGPDRPESCSEDLVGDSAIELNLIDGDDSHTMFVYYSVCRGNGFDDGTTLRELTKDGCQPLVRGPVFIWGGSSASVSRCMH